MLDSGALQEFVLEGSPVPMAPDDDERRSYAWRALPYLFGSILVSSFCLIIAQLLLEKRVASELPVVVPVFALYTLVFLVYQATSLPVNFTGRSFDLEAHDARVRAWQPEHYPSVDIFLPICREPLSVLTNTWAGVAELILAYPGTARAYVLDDGDSDAAAAAAQAEGFTYLRRPEHIHKKSGNLNYGFARSSGEQIVIFDADFRPRPDFLAETLPYMDDPTIGIVQTPQFFRVDQRQTWVERAAAPTLEIFYRSVQVSRNRFGSALCVGSNAVYRREALALSNGFTLIPYAEDSHTGLQARQNGYELTYLPVPLAAGVCPSTLDSYMRQQYRWCCGATSLTWTNHMWRVQMPLLSRVPYVAGWLWNLYTALRTLMTPVIPVVLLIFIPGAIQLRNFLLLLPAVLNGVVLYPLWHKTRYSAHVLPLSLATGWAQALALWDFARGRVMSWQPTRGPADASRRFWWGLTTWNGSLAIIWVDMAVYRTAATGSSRFAIVALFGVLNLFVVGRLVVPSRSAEAK